MPVADTIDPLGQFRLDGKVALVTGASSGLGVRFARVLHAAGATVVLAARRADRLRALEAELERSLAVPTDVTNDEAVAALVATAADRFGRLDVVVNNAGATDPVPALELDNDEFRRMVDVNLVAPFMVAKAAAPAMTGGGVIVNIGSIYGLVGIGAKVPSTGYAAAKAGVIGLTRELAGQWAARGIRVNALVPGWFRSEITEQMFDDERSSAWITRNALLGRAGEEHELDGALLFLASDASSFMTGQLLIVDGGWTAV